MCPIYDFECSKCGNIEEMNVKIADRNNEQECSSCGGPSKKLIGTPAVHLDLSFPGQELKYSNPDYRRRK